MAGIADTAKLIASLTLKDGFTGPIKNANKALNTLDANIAKSGSRAFKAGQQIGTGIRNGVKIAAAAVTGLAGLLLLSAHDGQKAQDVQIKFNTAVSNSGKVSAAYVKALNAQSTALSNLTGSDDEAITSTQTMLTTMGLSGEQILKLTPLILAAATATGRDLESVTLAVGRATQGSATSLGKIGIIIPKTAKAAKSAALASLEQAKAQLLIKENLDKSHGALTKNEKAQYAQRKAALDAAIAQQKLTDATKKGTAATDPYNQVLNVLQSRYKGVNEALSGQLDTRLAVLRERLQDVREEAGIKLLPSLTRIVDVVGTKLVPAFQTLIDAVLPSAITGLNELASFLERGGATEGVNRILQTVKDVAPIVQRSAEITGQVITTAVGLFKSLPPEIQGLAVAGLAINKLTGGLVTNIAGGLISAVIGSFKGLMNVNAAVVNVNGPVGGGPGNVVGDVVKTAGGAGLVAAAASVAAGVLAGTVIVAATKLFITDNIDPALRDAVNGVPGAGTPLGQRDPRRFNANGQVVQNVLTPLGKSASDLQEAASQQRNAARMFDSTGQDNAEAASQLRNAAHGLDSASAALRKSSFDIYSASAKARGFTYDPTKAPSTSLASRFKFLAGNQKGSKDVAVADALARHFETGTTPLYTSDKNLRSAIKALQADQKTLGPKSAKAIGADIDRLKAELARRIRATTTAVKNQKTNVTVNVKAATSTYINGRLLDANTNRFKSTIVGSRGAVAEFG